MDYTLLAVVCEMERPTLERGVATGESDDPPTRPGSRVAWPALCVYVEIEERRGIEEGCEIGRARREVYLPWSEMPPAPEVSQPPRQRAAISPSPTRPTLEQNTHRETREKPPSPSRPTRERNMDKKVTKFPLISPL